MLLVSPSLFTTWRKQTDKTDKKIYIDDLSLEVLTLKKMDQKCIGPLNFHERCGLHLPPDKSILQQKQADIQ